MFIMIVLFLSAKSDYIFYLMQRALAGSSGPVLLLARCGLQCDRDLRFTRLSGDQKYSGLTHHLFLA
jgi:hypothetical protein